MAAKLLILLIAGLFALGFGAGGIFGGILPLLDIARNGWSSRHWQQVPATLMAVDSEHGPQGRTETRVRYSYDFGGRNYESSRIGLGRPGADNIGSWQEDQYHRLRNAHRQERPVTAWVDPRQPHRSVLDRSIRWTKVIFHLPFALVFTAIGAVAAWAFAYVLATPLARLEGAPAQPAFAALDRRVRGVGLRLMALFWCVLGWPMTVLAWTEPQPWLARLLITLFAAVGGWLLLKAWRWESLPVASE